MAIEWLKNLNEYAELGRCRYEERLSEINGLPRGQYLRHKQDLLNEPAVVFHRSTNPAAELDALEGVGPIPEELRALLSWSDGLVNSTATRPILEVQIYGVESIGKFKAMGRDLVDRDELFPPLLKKLLFIGSDFGHRHLAVWVTPEIESSPVLLVDLAERTILILSHSLRLFFQRISFSIAAEIPFKVGTRSKKLRSFVVDSEPGPTYPPKVKGQTVFLFDDVWGFPSTWQAFLSDDDRSFRFE